MYLLGAEAGVLALLLALHRAVESVVLLQLHRLHLLFDRVHFGCLFFLSPLVENLKIMLLLQIVYLIVFLKKYRRALKLVYRCELVASSGDASFKAVSLRLPSKA